MQRVRMTHRLLHWADELRRVGLWRCSCLCLHAVSRLQQGSSCPLGMSFLRCHFCIPAFPSIPRPLSVAFIAIKGVMYFTNLSHVCLDLGWTAYGTQSFLCLYESLFTVTVFLPAIFFLALFFSYSSWWCWYPKSAVMWLWWPERVTQSCPLAQLMYHVTWRMLTLLPCPFIDEAFVFSMSSNLCLKVAIKHRQLNVFSRIKAFYIIIKTTW